MSETRKIKHWGYGSLWIAGYRLVEGDAYTTLKEFPDECIDTIVTSPPYWGLRDYNIEGQIGQERTIHEYIDRLLLVFDEVKRDRDLLGCYGRYLWA